MNMDRYNFNELFDSELIEALSQLPDYMAPTAWAGHIPFMFALFRLAQPRSFVELGVYNGASFLAACSAAARYKTQTLSYGIDTWRGDEHAGVYEGEQIMQSLLEKLERSYPNAKLMRGFFDEKLGAFDDGTIDVLHIDGLHTYEACKHDFETWLPKMSPSGIVMFHDTNVFERNFGVWKLWGELSKVYKSFDFKHSFGLGVLCVGQHPAPLFAELLDRMTSNPAYHALVLATCDHFGSTLPQRFVTREIEAQLSSTPQYESRQHSKYLRLINSIRNRFRKAN